MTSFTNMVVKVLGDRKTIQENIFKIHCQNLSVIKSTKITLEDENITITKANELREHFPLVTDEFAKKAYVEYGLEKVLQG